MAIDFNGINDAIRIGLSLPALNGVSKASMSCWVDLDNLPNPAVNDANAFCEYSIGPPPGTSEASRFAFEIQNPVPAGTNVRYAIVARTLDGDSGGELDSAAGTADAGRHFIVATMDYTNSIGRIYKDGALIVVGVIPGNTAGNVSATNSKVGGVGTSDSGVTEFLDGRLEDLRVYSRLLSGDEVQTMFACQGVDGIVFGLEQRFEMQSGGSGTPVNNIAVQDSAQDQISAAVLTGNPLYAESIGPTFRRRLP